MSWIRRAILLWVAPGRLVAEASAQGQEPAEAKEAVAELRSSIAWSLVWVVVSVVIGWGIAQLIGLMPSLAAGSLAKVLRFVGAVILGWAVLGRLGPEIRTWKGQTLPERLNVTWFRGLYLFSLSLISSGLLA